MIEAKLSPTGLRLALEAAAVKLAGYGSAGEPLEPQDLPGVHSLELQSLTSGMLAVSDRVGFMGYSVGRYPPAEDCDVKDTCLSEDTGPLLRRGLRTPLIGDLRRGFGIHVESFDVMKEQLGVIQWHMLEQWNDECLATYPDLFQG